MLGRYSRWRAPLTFDSRSFLKSILVFLMLMGFFLPAFALYARFDQQTRAERADQVASQLAMRLQQQLISRLEGLALLRHLIPALGLTTYADFATWAERFRTELPGFYSLNYISPEGYITWVVPNADNRAALGRFVLGREDVRPYLEIARQSRQPQVTPIIWLYQGFPGIVLYQPLFAKDGTFSGWLNGVCRPEALAQEVLKTDSGQKFRLSFRFKGTAGGTYQDPRPVQANGFIGHAEVPVLNQVLSVSVTMPPEEIASLRHLRMVIGFGVVASSMVLASLFYLVLRSRDRLGERLEKEHFQSILLNLLVHDMINPLLVVRLSTESALRVAPPNVREYLLKTSFAERQLGEIIGRVKDMRAAELGKLRLPLEAVAVNDIISETFAIFEARLKDKELIADFIPAAGDPKVMVERLAFQNNVINNVMSNAIKFTDRGGRIHLATETFADTTLIIISDNGIGMPPEILSGLFLEHRTVSKPGTLGEIGTGIGMLQIHSYTRLFGGRVRVESKQKIEGAQDHGTTVYLYLPRA